MNRRSFLLGLLASASAPVIAKAKSLGKLIYDKPTRSIIRTGLPTVSWRQISQGLRFSDFTSIHNGVPIREVAELLTRENDLLKDMIKVTRLDEPYQLELFDEDIDD